MRPVEKSPWPQVAAVNKVYRPHTIAKPDLENNLGHYCSYCEVFSSDLEVEHVISQNQDNTLTHNWDNFLLACGRCNGRDNKTNKPVDLLSLHFPHKNNTLLSFEYLEGGIMKVNSQLTGVSNARAEAMLNLVGLDKYPGNKKYPKHNPNDTRWNHRRVAWEYAVRYLADYEAGKKEAKDIVEFAAQKGFFSVWFTVFENHNDVKKELIESFKGTCIQCFDLANGFQLLHRNPANAADTI